MRSHRIFRIRGASVFGISLAATLFLPTLAFGQAPTADYEVVFEATWSAATHPVDFPAGAHFSPLVGGTHDNNVSFWQPGGLASLGIKRMAQSGLTTRLVREMDDEILNGFADQSFVGFGVNSPGITSLMFTVDQNFPELTLVTMIAPSPDWFAGVHDIPLFDQGWWVPEIVVDLLAYDAGTDDGITYLSLDVASNPPLPIALQGAPLQPGVPVGTMTIRRLPEPGSILPLLAGGVLIVAWGRRKRPL